MLTRARTQDVEAMQRLAEAAIAAAERATAAAAAAASGELHRALPPAAGSVLPDALAMTELECVVHSNPALHRWRAPCDART